MELELKSKDEISTAMYYALHVKDSATSVTSKNRSIFSVIFQITHKARTFWAKWPVD